MVGPKYAEYKCTLTTIEKMYYSPGQIQTCRRTQLTSRQSTTHSHKRKKPFFLKTNVTHLSLYLFLSLLFFRKVSFLFYFFPVGVIRRNRPPSNLTFFLFAQVPKFFVQETKSLFFILFFLYFCRVGSPRDGRCVDGKASRVSSFTVLFRSAQFVAGLKKKKKKFCLFREKNEESVLIHSSTVTVITRQSDRVGVISTRATQPQREIFFFLSVWRHHKTPTRFEFFLFREKK